MGYLHNIIERLQNFISRIKQKLGKKKDIPISEKVTTVKEEREELKSFQENDQEITTAEEDEIKKKKPYIKKTPNKLGKGKISRGEKASRQKQKEEEIIYLGNIYAKPRKPKKLETSKKDTKLETSRRLISEIRRPYIELDFSLYEIVLVIPTQIIKLDAPINSVNYKIEINNKKITRSTKIRNIDDKFHEVEKIAVELTTPLQNFQIEYPQEFRKTRYVFRYKHKDLDLYIFNGRYRNRAKMIELWNEEGNLNIIPKKKIWILHSDECQLEKTPNLIEDTFWIWNFDNPKLLDLTNASSISLRNIKNNKFKRYPCDVEFYLEGKIIPGDDFDTEYPIFTSNEISIHSPRINQEGWIVWLQNEGIGADLIHDNWTGENPIILTCPDDLSIDCGSFQIDICSKKNRIPIQTLFFRYVPIMKIEYPRDLIIPDENGHKPERVEIDLKHDISQWDLNTDQTINSQIDTLRKEFLIEIPKKIDTVNLTLEKKKLTQEKFELEITIPRLKWRIGEKQEWTGRVHQIKRESLASGIDFPIEVMTNDYHNQYQIDSVLRVYNTLEDLQEFKLERKYSFYSFYLNPFFTTILSSNEKLGFYFRITNITRKKEYDVIYLIIPETEKSINDYFRYLLNCPFKEKNQIISYFNNYSKKSQIPTTLNQLFEILTLAFNSSESLENPGKIFDLISKANKKFQIAFIESLPRMFKNIILNMGTTGHEIRDKIEYLRFIDDFKKSFNITVPKSQNIFKAIVDQKKAIYSVINNHEYYNRVFDILEEDIPDIKIILLKKGLKEAIKILQKAKEHFNYEDYNSVCILCYKSAFLMLKSYLNFKDIRINSQDQTIYKMYLIGFKEELGKYLDNYKRMGYRRQTLNRNHSMAARTITEIIYKEIKNRFSFLKRKEI